MLKRDERGFTLVELLIVLIILALLVAIVIPAISGFLGRGREQSYDGDKRNLQAAVDAYYTDSSLKVTVGGVGYNVFPSDYNSDGAWGVVTRAVNVVMTVSWLKDKGYIRDVPVSAAPANGDSSYKGHYVWVIEGSSGTVYGCPTGTDGGDGTWSGVTLTSDCVYDGQYP